MATGPRPYAITVNWNRAEDTVQCVRSIVEGNPGVGVVVVDNGSTDGSKDVLRLSFPDIELIENQENLGYTRGANQGVRRALERGATHVLMINNDAVAGRGMVSGLMEALECHPRVGIVGPKIFYSGTDVIWFDGGNYYGWLGVSTHPRMDRHDDGRDRERQVDFITGCVMLVKAEVFADVGLFDEDFIIYMEDLDLCLRARDQGYESWSVPKVTAEHQVSLSTGIAGSNRMTSFRSYYYGRNMLLLTYKRRKGLRALPGLYGQTLVLIPYYFMLIAIQGTKGAFRQYMRGYLHALRTVVSGYDKGLPRP
jgi:GT2 family glycosyltransferase